MARVYKNLQQGEVASMDASTTTITFITAKTPTFSLVTGEEAALTVDNEIMVLVGPYTSGTTTGTVRRGEEGTTKATHAANAKWEHAPTAFDYVDRFTGEFSGAAVSFVTAPSTAAGQWANLPGSTVEYDTSGYWVAGSPAQFTIPRSGYYAIFADLAEMTFSSTNVGLRATVSGVVIASSVAGGESASHANFLNTVAPSFSTVKFFAAGTVVVFQVGNGHPSANLTVSSLFKGRFGISRIRGTASDGAFVGARAFDNTTTTGSTRKLPIGQVGFDSHGFYDGANNRLTVPAGQSGYYHIVAYAYQYSGANDRLIYINGSSVAMEYGSYAQTATCLRWLNAGDYVEIWVNGGSFGHVSAPTAYTRLEITKLGQALQTKLSQNTDVSIPAAPTTDAVLGFNTSLQKWEAQQAASFSGATVTRTTAQGITSGSWVAVIWQAVSHDRGGYVNLVTNSTRFTIPQTGYYHISALLGYAGNSQGTRGVAIRKNGTTFLSAAGYMPGGTGVVRYPTQTDAYLLAGDYIEIMALHSAGGTLDVDGTPEYTNASIHRIRGDGNTVTFVGAAAEATTTAQTFTTGAWATVQFSAAQIKYDTLAFFDDANDRFVVPAGGAGKYMCVGYMFWAPNNAGLRYVAVYKNGALVRRTLSPANNGSENHVTAVLDLVPGDYVELRGLQSSGGNLDAATGAGNSPAFEMVKLGHANHTHKAEADTAWKVVGAAGQPAFQNGWVAYSADYIGAQFRKTAEGVVHLRGLIKSGTSSLAAFTLPVGYRPSQPGGNTLNTHHPIAVANSNSTLYISGDGEVKPLASPAWVSLDGVTFFAEQ